MKYGKEIGIEAISPNVKQGDKNIKRILYGINKILYDNNKRFISPQVASIILEQLKEYGKELKDLAVSQSCETKKTEILSELRRICKSIIQYKKEFIWDDESVQQVNTTMKYQLSMYIKERDSSTFDELSFLKRNKEIWETMYLPCINHESINTKKFEEMQQELLDRINAPYLLVS